MSEATTDRVEARLATAEDLPALEANETEATKGLSKQYLELQEQGDYHVVVGLLNGEVVARTILDCRNEEGVLVPEMKLLYVVPSARRRGLGNVMTAYLERLAAEKGYDEVFLGVTPDNPAAIPLYVGLGYTPTGEHRGTVNKSVIEEESFDTDEPTEAIFRKSLRVR